MRKCSSTYGILFLLLFFLQSAAAQQNVAFDEVISKLTSYVSNESPEKTYVQTDKDFYANGETIWFKAYLLDGITHKKSDKSKVVYVMLVSATDSIIAQRKLYIAQTATAGEIKLPEKIEKGIYTLRIYTKYMLKDEKPILYEKQISVVAFDIKDNRPPNSTNINPQESVTKKKGRPNLRFFPEGGHLVSGITSVVGIKATDQNGTGIALQGTIVDDDDNLVVVFKTFDFGLGTLNYTPKYGKTYFALILVDGEEEKYPMPMPLSKGYTLNVVDHDSHIGIKVTTNFEKGVEGTWLLGHIRGRSFMKRKIKSASSTYSIKFSKKDLSDGIAHFTLFTENGEPVCERLVFVDDPENDIIISGKTPSSAYAKRDKVTLKIAAKDAKGKPVSGTMGVSVVSENSTPQRRTSTIKSWLLLNSDIGGMVPDADFFFDPDTKSTPFLRDALLLTHGWRRFVWKDMALDDLNKKRPFDPELGIMINGKTTSFHNKYQPRKSKVKLSILGKNIFQDVKMTNAQGHFSFGPFILPDSAEVHLKAEPLIASKKKRENELAIYLDPPVSDTPIGKKIISDASTLKLHVEEAYLRAAYKKKAADFKYDPKVTQLEGTTVTAKKKTRKQLVDDEIMSFTLYGVPHSRIFPDSIPGSQVLNVFDLLMGVPGIEVFGTAPAQTAIISRHKPLGGPPLFLINGIITDIRAANTLLGVEIAFIDVLRGANASVYGVRGASGVISVYTHVGPFNANKLDLENGIPKSYPNFSSFKINGIYKSREFYAPDYTVPKPEHRREDYRTTMHWEPDVQMGTNGEVKLEFFTGDNSGAYCIEIEGITDDGMPFRTRGRFEVETSQ